MIKILLGIIFCISLSIALFSWYYVFKQKQAYSSLSILKKDNQEYQEQKSNLLYDIKELKQQLLNEQNKILMLKKTETESQNMALVSFEQYCEMLNNSYTLNEQKFDNKLEQLKAKHLLYKEQYANELSTERAEIDKLKQTRAAIIAAQLKEQEIKEQQDYYCLKITEEQKDDILVLERIKYKLNDPRILSMLIWSTYYQKEMTALCTRILKTDQEICGIYKITNQINNLCYIGQSKNVSKRWKEHAKCGLGIDTPAKNKLYNAMQEDGLYNFSWELLEECPKEELNEKEKFYIELYQSKDYGYNSTKGNL